MLRIILTSSKNGTMADSTVIADYPASESFKIGPEWAPVRDEDALSSAPTEYRPWLIGQLKSAALRGERVSGLAWSELSDLPSQISEQLSCPHAGVASVGDVLGDQEIFHRAGLASQIADQEAEKMMMSLGVELEDFNLS